MRTLTILEVKQWCLVRAIELDRSGLPIHPAQGFHNFSCKLPPSISQLTWFSRFIESSLKAQDKCLLWVTAWGVWPSSENWHLYYKMRESYGDHRSIDDAPAQLFLEYEQADLASFLEIGFISGWDIHLISNSGDRRVFISHDEFVEMSMKDSKQMEQVKIALADAGLKSF